MVCESDEHILVKQDEHITVPMILVYGKPNLYFKLYVIQTKTY